MSENKQAKATVTPITTDEGANAPSREERAAKLHHEISLANPGRCVEVTIGNKYGSDKGITISTKRDEQGPLVGGFTLGILATAAIATTVVLVLDAKAKRRAVEVWNPEPIEVSED